MPAGTATATSATTTRTRSGAIEPTLQAAAPTGPGDGHPGGEDRAPGDAQPGGEERAPTAAQAGRASTRPATSTAPADRRARPTSCRVLPSAITSSRRRTRSPLTTSDRGTT